MAICTGAARAGSIFDDDYKPPPDPTVKSDPKPTERPPDPPAPPRLAPPKAPPVRRPASKPPAPAPALPTPPTSVTPQALIVAPLPPRDPIPVASDLASAEKTVKEVFKTEYDARTPGAKIVLARALMNEASQTSGESALRFVVLREARESAVAGGDVVTAVDAVRALRDTFIMTPPEALEMERTALTGSVKNLLTYPVNSELYDDYRSAIRLCMAQAEVDLTEGRYDVAIQGANIAELIARRMNNIEMIDRVRARSATLAGIAAEASLVRPAFAALKSNPADPAAALAVGRFYAFAMDRLDAGLPYLQKGSDPVMKGLAASEATSPVAPAEQLALADGWAAVSKTAPPGPARDGMQRRALYWYDTAIAALDGLPKAAAQKRAMDVRAGSLRPGLLGDYFRGTNGGFKAKVFSRVDQQIEFDWRGHSPGDGIGGAHFTVRWNGYIKAPVAGDYKLIAVHDDGVRIWLDGARVMDRWGLGAFRHGAIVHLDGTLQHLKIEYWQGDGGSVMGLGWVLPHATKARAIPVDALFHDPIPAGPYLPIPRTTSNGTIVLDAASADLHNGYRFKYVDKNNNEPDALTAWQDPSAWISWDFAAPEGDYQMDLLYACPPKSAGCAYAVSVGSRRWPRTVASTGGWEKYDSEPIGRVHLSAGGQFVKLDPQGKFRDGLMNFAQILLTPVRD